MLHWPSTGNLVNKDLLLHRSIKISTQAWSWQMVILSWDHLAAWRHTSPLSLFLSSSLSLYQNDPLWHMIDVFVWSNLEDMTVTLTSPHTPWPWQSFLLRWSGRSCTWWSVPWAVWWVNLQSAKQEGLCMITFIVKLQITPPKKAKD